MLKYISEKAEQRRKLSADGETMKNKTTFEENLKKLGEIAEVLEKGEIPLEKAVGLYSESVKIASLCRKQLDDARIKITEDGGDILPKK